MRVQVYWNSHKKVFSIRDKATRKVIAHETRVVLRDAKFHVGQGGRRRALEQGVRNNHAWVEGTRYHGRPRSGGKTETVIVAYSPLKDTQFKTSTGRGVRGAEWVSLSISDAGSIVYAYNPVYIRKGT